MPLTSGRSARFAMFPERMADRPQETKCPYRIVPPARRSTRAGSRLRWGHGRATTMQPFTEKRIKTRGQLGQAGSAGMWPVGMLRQELIAMRARVLQFLRICPSRWCQCVSCRQDDFGRVLQRQCQRDAESAQKGHRKTWRNFEQSRIVTPQLKTREWDTGIRPKVPEFGPASYW